LRCKVRENNGNRNERGKINGGNTFKFRACPTKNPHFSKKTAKILAIKKILTTFAAELKDEQMQDFQTGIAPFSLPAPIGSASVRFKSTSVPPLMG
jgi:hypothetical protein